MNTVDFPCKGCEERKSGCHSSCAKYLEAKKRRDEDREEEHKRYEINSTIERLRSHRVRSLRRGYK